MSKQALHQPVMLKEALTALQIKANHWYLDATFGRGGHTSQILAQGAKVIALDWDDEAIAWGKQTFANQLAAGQLILIKTDFKDLATNVTALQKANPSIKIAGILFDFGTSVDQLKSEERGLSFANPNAPLDMRMDQSKKLTAADYLNLTNEQELATIFFHLGGEKQARKIAHQIVVARKKQALQTVGDLTAIVAEVKKDHFGHLHPATKIFQALRIIVNQELESIKEALPQAFSLLEPQARLVTIAFHEGEDRLAKNYFKDWHQQQLGQLITKKPLTPSQEELDNNQRARSAKLRIFEKN